jgi:hypothetical protein
MRWKEEAIEENKENEKRACGLSVKVFVVKFGGGEGKINGGNEAAE